MTDQAQKKTYLIVGIVGASLLCSVMFCCCVGMLTQRSDDAGDTADAQRFLELSDAQRSGAVSPKAKGAQVEPAAAQLDAATKAQLAPLEEQIETIVGLLFEWSELPDVDVLSGLDVKSHKQLELTRELLSRSLGAKRVKAHITGFDGKYVSAYAYVSRSDDASDPRRLRFSLQFGGDKKKPHIKAWIVERVMHRGGRDEVVSEWEPYAGHPAPNKQADLALLGSYYDEIKKTLWSKSCKRERELELKRTSDYVSTMKGSARDQRWFDRQMEWVKPNCDSIRRLRRGYKQSVKTIAYTQQLNGQTELLWLTNGMFERQGEVEISHVAKRRSAKISEHTARFIYLGRRLPDGMLDWYLYRVTGSWR